MGEIVNVLQDTFDTMMGGVTRESERAKMEKQDKASDDRTARLRDFATRVAEQQLRRELLREQRLGERQAQQVSEQCGNEQQEQREGEQHSGSDSDSDSDSEDDTEALNAMGAGAVGV